MQKKMYSGKKKLQTKTNIYHNININLSPMKVVTTLS